MEKVIERYIEQFTDPTARLGTTYIAGQGTYVRLWAPKFEKAEIEWVGQGRAALQAEDGYFTGHFPDIDPGTRYWFHLDGDTRIADPASRFQPEDTLGPSEVVAPSYDWTDEGWKGVPYTEWVIYEIHPGTYSDSHDFDGIIADLPRLKALGVTTLEIMPVSQFSGGFNWGYDGVFPHAVQHSYGGPQKLKQLVDACHASRLAIILDCVYNHVGPEGNVLFGCGPYVRDKYHTPWGPGINFDGSDSDNVRRYFLQSAWQWLTEYHFDGLRLDAVQMIFDNAPLSFLQELSLLKDKASMARGLPLILTAESDLNDPRLLAPASQHGLGMDGAWADDFHHCLHATLTGEHDGYYADYGGLAQLAHIYRRGVALEGDYSPYRKRRHGGSYEGIDKKRLIVETQNHDQIGNRLMGERLVHQIGIDKAKLAAACVLLSPFTPFLFMGEELAAEVPFMYFISHHDTELVEAVRKGRREEWKDFSWTTEPPDPAGPETYDKCVLKNKAPVAGTPQAQMQDYYRRLIALSKKIRQYGEPEVLLDEAGQMIRLVYKGSQGLIQVVLSFGEQARTFTPDGRWTCVLRSDVTEQKEFEVTEALQMAPFAVAVFEG